MFTRNLTLTVCFMLLLGGTASADLNAYIEDLNIAADGDIGGFRAELGARFGVSSSQLEIVLHSVDCPGDAAIVFWLGEQARQPLDQVLRVYRSQKPRGWGAVAKSLGIKPGSAAFHALKNGTLQLPVHHHNQGFNQPQGKGHKKDKPKKVKLHG